MPRTHLDHPAGITAEQAESYSFGQAHWWVRNGEGDFVKLPKRVRGDQALDQHVDLEPGSYTLGVGPAREGVRFEFDVEEAAEAEVTTTAPAADISGKRFVFTGDLDCMGRDELKPFLAKLDAKVTGSVSGKTDYVVVGHDPGARKIEKAQQLGTTILDEEEFKALAGIQTTTAAVEEDTGQARALRYLRRVSPSASDEAAARKVATPDNFDDLGENKREIWGIAIGPRGGRYDVHIDLGNRNTRWALACNCSGSRPCRHALALLITAAEHWIPPADPPSGHRESAQDRYSFME